MYQLWLRLWFPIKLFFWRLWPFKGLDDTRGGPYFISPSQSLFQSASHGDGPALQLAFLLGANPNVTKQNGWTPIFHAHPLAIPYLISKGADLEHRNAYGCTPLLANANWSQEAGHERSPAARIEALIAAGADQTATDPAGHTWQQLRQARIEKDAREAAAREEEHRQRIAAGWQRATVVFD